MTKSIEGLEAVNTGEEDAAKAVEGVTDKTTTEVELAEPQEDNGAAGKAKGSSRSSAKGKSNSGKVDKTDDDPLNEMNVGFSPTLARLKRLQRGAIVKLDDLDSGQVRANGNNEQWIKFFASLYRNHKPVPAGVGIKIKGKAKIKVVDGNKRSRGRKQAGFDDFELDVYEGTELDAINVGLELNRGGDRLKPADVVHAAVMTQTLGVRPNISELARMAGVSRPTVRKLYQQEMAKTGGVLDGYKQTKPPKTNQEIAEEFVAKILDAVEDGVEVIELFFDTIPDDLRQQYLQTLRERYGDKTGA